MKFKHLLLASASCLLIGTGAANAQSNKNYGCYTDEHQRELELKDPSLRLQRQAIDQQIQQWVSKNSSQLRSSGPVIKIPVVVHVVTEKGLNGMSKAQVLDGIQVLNDDLRRLNTDANVTRPIFAPYAADMEIEFTMARLDPQGQPTEGIVRVTHVGTNGFANRDDIKRVAPAWPAEKYFNVWLINVIGQSSGGGTVLGYAQFPSLTNSSNLDRYGVVMLHNQWGKQGRVPGSTATSDGRTATHEIGHCINLYHTFQGGCGTTCNNTGDQVCDTPPALNDTYLQCNNNLDNCTNDKSGGTSVTNPYTAQTNPYITNPATIPTQTENYMSYDQCQNMFTKGQKDRAYAAINSIGFLANLTSTTTQPGQQPNAIVTGIDPSVNVGALVPTPYFAVNNNRICAGGSVNFTDVSYNGNVTSWIWSFPGGTPSTSTQQNPIVTYNTPGLYDVTLTAGNSDGSRTDTKTGVIRVLSTTALTGIGPSNQFIESFEEASFPVNSIANKTFELQTTSINQGALNWERTSAAATHGSSSLRLRNASAENGVVSTFITPNIDISGVTGGLTVSFDLAFAQKSTAPTEDLKVYISNDCGATWFIRYSKAGSQLVTNNNVVVNGTFTPGANDWRTERITIANNFLAGGRLMFKFEATSKGGNNMYIDYLRIFTTLGTNEEVAKNNQISVYPNPVTSETGINFELNASEKVDVKIYDLIGNIVYAGATQNLPAGKHSIALYDKVKNASAGMYMVQLTIGNKVFNSKLLVK